MACRRIVPRELGELPSALPRVCASVRFGVYICQVSSQGISDDYLSKRPASSARAKPVQARQRFAVSKAVLVGEEPLHRVLKKGSALCGAALADDISIVLERIENVPRCDACGEKYARKVLAKARRTAKRKKNAPKKRPVSAKERKADAAKRGMKSWRPELYPGESADRNTGKSGPVPRPIGAPSLGKRR